MTQYLLGIDNGGTVSKVVLFDATGREIAVSSRKGDITYSQPGWSERLMEDIWADTAEAIREVLTKSGIKAEQIAAVGNTSFGNGLFLLDKKGQPLRPAILSVDGRAEAIVKGWATNSTATQLWQQTYQQLWAAQTAALLAWIKQHEPEIYQNIGAVLLCKDYIKYCLTGQLCTDTTAISGTNLLDLETRAYNANLLGLLGLAEIWTALPAIYESSQVIGYITQHAAADTNLAEGTPVVAGMFDVAACALGAGVLQPGQACIIAGTWSINEVVTDRPIEDPNLFCNYLYTNSSVMAMEASATSASNLEWFVAQWMGKEQAEAEARGVSVYELCNAQVANLDSTDVIFHPFLFGSNISNVGPLARAGFYGMGGWHTKAHLLRAVYEGIVYSHLYHMEKLRHAGIEVTAARLTGGGARSTVWAQMFADALGFPMEIVAGSEVGAHGAALCAGVGVGVYADYHSAIAQAVQVNCRFTPNPDKQPQYMARYQEYQFIARAMEAAWQRLIQLPR